jgi:hypothetical protein
MGYQTVQSMRDTRPAMSQNVELVKKGVEWRMFGPVQEALDAIHELASSGSR